MSRTRVLAYAGVVLLCLSCCVLLPCVPFQKIRNGESRIYSTNNLKQISLGLLSYHDAFKKLPPAVVTDKDGKPLYSWRVLLLPFLEQSTLYNEFHRDEPWDSPHNKPLLTKMPSCYAAYWKEGETPDATHYQVFVGPGTAFERPGLTLADFPDGLDKTLLVIEAADAVPWSKPADLTYDPKGPLPALGGLCTKPGHFLCYEVSRQPVIGVAFADGQVRFVPSGDHDNTIRAFITRNGSEPVELD